ncbi:hypothetical protein DPMN_001292 [Dreissena polymorpha]|uniref:Uncharacterized protein n=1 Tax=Dreissena polymorpha TaxID=45954 RepID=A0A9D4RSS6_DREPO|nr:hypothetical protein DPMN_001292 [Dreissena polymorpha]
MYLMWRNRSAGTKHHLFDIVATDLNDKGHIVGEQMQLQVIFQYCPRVNIDLLAESYVQSTISE